MITIKLKYQPEIYYCPECGCMYFRKVECVCPNLIVMPDEEVGK